LEVLLHFLLNNVNDSAMKTF